MKTSKQKKELIDSIKEMEDVYNDQDTPQDMKDSLAPSIKRAKELLSELEAAEKKEETEVKAEKKAAKTASPAIKKVKAVAKKKAEKKVRAVKKQATAKLPAFRAAIRKAQAALTKIKGRTKRGQEADASRKALPPGTRVSASGKTYREYRENRADVQRKKAPYLAEGGSVGDEPPTESPASVEQINVFGYQTQYLPQEVVAEFAKAITAVEGEPDKESIFYHNSMQALKAFAAMIDSAFLGLQAHNLKLAFSAALMSGVYNYKSGLHISAEVLTEAMVKVWKANTKMFARGGRLKSALNRDRAYKSDEPWEQAYHRQTRPKNPRYAAEGLFMDPFEADWSKPIDGKSYTRDENNYLVATISDSETGNIYNPEDICYVNKREFYGHSDPFFNQFIEDIEQETGWKYDKDYKLDGVFFNPTDRDKHLAATGKKLSRGGKFKINKDYEWFVYDADKKTIVAGNKYKEDANDVLKDFKEARPGRNLKLYSADHLKHKVKIDPYDSDNWSNLAFLGMTLINGPDNTLIANSQAQVI